jgi:hypothetical protein
MSGYNDRRSMGEEATEAIQTRLHVASGERSWLHDTRLSSRQIFNQTIRLIQVQSHQMQVTTMASCGTTSARAPAKPSLYPPCSHIPGTAAGTATASPTAPRNRKSIKKIVSRTIRGCYTILVATLAFLRCLPRSVVTHQDTRRDSHPFSRSCRSFFKQTNM